MGDYIPLDKLEVYQLARELSRIAWHIFEKLNWKHKKLMDFQFIESTDSVGANIAESYGRFHYLDRIKFLHYSRGSLMECNDHWLELLFERNIIDIKEFDDFKRVSSKLSLKLNNYINTIYKSKNELISHLSIH